MYVVNVAETHQKPKFGQSHWSKVEYIPGHQRHGGWTGKREELSIGCKIDTIECHFMLYLFYEHMNIRNFVDGVVVNTLIQMQDGAQNVKTITKDKKLLIR